MSSLDWPPKASIHHGDDVHFQDDSPSNGRNGILNLAPLATTFMSRFFDDPCEIDECELVDMPSEDTLERVAYNFRYIRSCKSMVRFLFRLGWPKEKVKTRTIEAVQAARRAQRITAEVEAVLLELASRAIEDVSSEIPPLDEWIQATVARNQGYVRVEPATSHYARGT
jgi:uncharacterized protein (DUF2132 family)